MRASGTARTLSVKTSIKQHIGALKLFVELAAALDDDDGEEEDRS